VGLGRLSEVEKIMGGIRHVLGLEGDLAGKKIVVSAGPTQEPIDPVRYIGNRSSGKMGFAIAEAARDRGAKVTLVTGPTALTIPYAVDGVHVARAQEMRDAVVAATADADVLIMSAAVADYQAGEPVGEKIKRGERDGLDLHLVRTPDVLAEVASRPGLVKVGFAAESHEVIKHARDKVGAKGLDLIVANDITEPGSGFGTDTNRIVIVDRSGEEEALPQLPKYEAAWRILDRVSALLGRGSG
jgi:phosphopantothenoylcysteine decarboxylase/phosphopantothenate--cysteine ligase